MSLEATKRRPRGKSTFSVRDVARAIKAAKKGGLDVGRVEIDKDGRIAVISAMPETPSEVAAHHRRGKPWRILGQQD